MVISRIRRLVYKAGFRPKLGNPFHSPSLDMIYAAKKGFVHLKGQDFDGETFLKLGEMKPISIFGPDQVAGRADVSGGFGTARARKSRIGMGDEMLRRIRTLAYRLGLRPKRSSWLYSPSLNLVYSFKKASKNGQILFEGVDFDGETLLHPSPPLVLDTDGARYAELKKTNPFVPGSADWHVYNLTNGAWRPEEMGLTVESGTNVEALRTAENGLFEGLDETGTDGVEKTT